MSRPGLRSSRWALALVGFEALLAGCTPSPSSDLVTYHSTQCQLIAAPTVSPPVDPWIGCRVSRFGRTGPLEVLVEPVGYVESSGFTGRGLRLVLNATSPATGAVAFNGAQGVAIEPPIGTAWATFRSPGQFLSMQRGSGTLTTNVSGFDPEDFRLSLTFDGVELSGDGPPITLSGTLIIGAGASRAATPFDSGAPDVVRPDAGETDAPPVVEPDTGPTCRPLGAQCGGIRGSCCSGFCRPGAPSTCDSAPGCDASSRCSPECPRGWCPGSVQTTQCTPYGSCCTIDPTIQCGDNGCGTILACPSGAECAGTRCINTCGPGGSRRCPAGQSCQGGVCTTSTCLATCGINGSTCGIRCDGFVCGTCRPGLECVPMGTGSYCTGTCTPNCAGRSCGSDGCAGTCGTCPAGQTCNATTGQCSGGSTSACGTGCPAPQTCQPWGCSVSCSNDRECPFACCRNNWCVPSSMCGSGTGTLPSGCTDQSRAVTATLAPSSSLCTGGAYNTDNSAGVTVECRYTTAAGSHGCAIVPPGHQTCTITPPPGDRVLNYICVSPATSSCTTAIGCS
jgi:hypothetical protein